MAVAKKSATRKYISSEHQEQVALFSWARNKAVLAKYPELELLSCSLNGVKLGAVQAKKMKAAGMLAGEHDVRLPVARGGYHCLSIEMKAGDNRPTIKQLDYGTMLEEEGGYVRYCWSFEEAKKVIEDYLKLPRM